MTVLVDLPFTHVIVFFAFTVGEGVAVTDGVGDAVAVGVGVGDALTVGVGVGVGVGVTSGTGNGSVEVMIRP